MISTWGVDHGDDVVSKSLRRKYHAKRHAKLSRKWDKLDDDIYWRGKTDSLEKQEKVGEKLRYHQTKAWR